MTTNFFDHQISSSQELQLRRNVRYACYVIYFFCCRDLIFFFLAIFGYRFAYNFEMDLSSLLGIVLLFMIALGVKHYSLYSAILINLILSVDLFDSVTELHVIRIGLTLFWLSFTARGAYALFKLHQLKLIKRSLVTHHIVTNSIVTSLFMIYVFRLFIGS
ncbi:MAG: hypothetical protein KDD94_11855 [Calditrichaeota bacterium]|nr:hypothetical protein [Calditrichota bacterium]